MIKPYLAKIQRIKAKLQVKKPWDSIIIFALNVLIAIPLFIIIHQNLIDPEWPFHLDRILIGIVLIVGIQLVLRLMKTILIVCIALYLLALVWGTLFGNYGFNAVYEDYRSMVYTMADDPNPQDIIISKLLPFPNKSLIIDAVDYNNPDVRNFALMATTKYFRNVPGYKKERQMIQCFAVFKEIRNRWNYVDDPRHREYIANASESVQHFSGDCDDHAILMSACIRAVGGIPRIIHTGGHLYPEMLIGDKTDLETANYLIKEVLFVEESRGKEIHYHIDERGQIWLNLDYTARFPGGPFMSEEILGALTFN
ncbi:transglutaminase family protein [Flavobacterium sp. MFBS3-15]|uniref:transglutaminase-like domain-containing protein n=1 Tax=Flavobacterium sp. MFBS3-15 TaxID=2989816 RepID=UPI002236415A|nr:transglutaminase family protein [Flavobacterium sp. MFBS3-15]MCW4470576.1 transglutaminase family protein [Flavobacterium sp. MFBS3-15]